MIIRATRKLRINALLLGLGVLLVTLGFNVLLSVSTLNTLATDMVLSGYRFCQQAVAREQPIAALNLGRTRADEVFTLKVEQRCETALTGLLERLGLTLQ